MTIQLSPLYDDDTIVSLVSECNVPICIQLSLFITNSDTSFRWNLEANNWSALFIPG